MQPFTTLSGIAAPLLRDNVNTDQICPVLPLRILDPDYAAQLFLRWRRNTDGGENTEFVLNQPQFQQPRILVGGRNFGSGSARESAAWAISAFGIRCIIARSFGELFRGNCIRNGILPIVLSTDQSEAFEERVLKTNGAKPFTVDLASGRIICPDGLVFTFEIDPADRTALLEGLDEIGLTLKYVADIAAWEEKCRARQPWLQTMTRNPAGRIDVA